jgi:hypothetical protein
MTYLSNSATISRGVKWSPLPVNNFRFAISDRLLPGPGVGGEKNLRRRPGL